MRVRYGKVIFFYFKQKTAYEMRISDLSSDVCSSDLPTRDRAMTDAAGIIRDLGLKPHPEGGHYCETFRDAACLGSGTTARGASTAIYFLLQAGERSHWHRVDAAEAWRWYAGAPLRLMVSADGRPDRKSVV